MPYTLMKGLVWILLAVLLGMVIGWLLRSVAAKRQVERARSGNIDAAELDRLRARVANLEPIVNERDQLRAELEAARSAIPAPEPADRAIEPGGSPNDDRSTLTEATPADGDSTDVEAAASVLGRPVELDDLQVVEGIGPKIAELCHGIGIRTWAELSVTEVSLLRTMLTDAGQRFKAHDPSTWPKQAALLASGSWTAFKAYTDELDGGRTVS